MDDAAWDNAAWDTLVKQAAAALKPGGYLIARSMLRETLAFKSDLHFDRETVELEDSSPLCPVVWIGKKSAINLKTAIDFEQKVTKITKRARMHTDTTDIAEKKHAPNGGVDSFSVISASS